MEPRDKSGALVYSYVFRKMREAGRKLESAGYRETGTQNLFVCQYANMAFMADMRGTARVPIYRDPRPVVYLSKSHRLDRCVATAAFQIEMARLRRCGVVFRIDPRDEFEMDLEVDEEDT